MSNKMGKVQIGDFIDILTDYHSNGSYESLRDNVTLLREKSYAVMIRTLNFERNDFKDDLIYVDEKAYYHLSKSKVYPNDILINKIANPGSIYIMPDLQCPVTCGMNLFLIRFSTAVNQRYMYYCMKNAEDYIKSFAHGTTTKTITKEEIKNIDLLIHIEKSDQDIIEKLLTSIDKKISLNNLINNILEKQLHTIYDYWFTQFDFPDEKGKPYRSSGGKMVWNEELKRLIPEGWSVMPLLNYVTWESNSQPPKSEFVYTPKKGYVRFIQNRDYDSDGYKTYIPYKHSLSMVDKFDILMDKYGDAGAIRYGIAGAFNVALGKICVHDADMQEYIRSYLGSAAVYNYLHNSCMASTRASLSENNLSFLKIIVPSKELLRKYQEMAHKMRSLILDCSDQNRQCVAIRDWLLPMLMNGQATVAD